MFGALDNILNKAMNLNESEGWLFVIDKTVQDEIIRLNTEDQLEEDGIDSKNRKLGDYTVYTKDLKRQKGQRIDHITLKDTGAFYESFRVLVNKSGITIIADDSSKYDVPLTKSFGLDILGLTEDNKEWLHDFLIERYHEFIKRELFQ